MFLSNVLSSNAGGSFFIKIKFQRNIGINSIKPFEHICFNNSDILFIFALDYSYCHFRFRALPFVFGQTGIANTVKVERFDPEANPDQCCPKVRNMLQIDSLTAQNCVIRTYHSSDKDKLCS